MARELLSPLLLPASIAGAAPLRLPHGTAPSSPADGEVWTTSAGLYVRVNGTTVGPLATAGGSSGFDLVTSGSFSTATSVSIDNCFTSTYDYYRMLIFTSSTSTGQELRYRFRASSTDESSSSYTWQNFQVVSTSLSGSRSTGQSYGTLGRSDTGSAFISDVFAPAVSGDAATVISFNIQTTSSPNMYFRFGGFAGTLAFDGITFYPDAGDMTGTYFIYGYGS